ncbi:MAG: hypothetical protein WC238_05525 [Parcubacteria group bacterium]
MAKELLLGERKKSLAKRRKVRFLNLVETLEKSVVNLLGDMQEKGALHSFRSCTDGLNGSRKRLFQVRLIDNGEVRDFRIVVTKRTMRSPRLCDVPQIIVTPEMRQERIWEHIVKLF